jgi:hypothetical protein
MREISRRTYVTADSGVSTMVLLHDNEQSLCWRLLIVNDDGHLTYDSNYCYSAEEIDRKLASWMDVNHGYWEKTCPHGAGDELCLECLASAVQ